MVGARGPTRRTLVAFLRVPRNRRRAARERGGLRALLAPARRLVPLAIALVLVLGVWPLVRERAARHPYFAVREVTVHSRGHLDPATLRTLTGIEPGSSIWGVDERAVVARLAANPWVRTARVRRELPSRVMVHVHQYRPMAIVAVADPAGGLFYAVRPGRIIARLGADDPVDLPYVTGLPSDALGASGSRALTRALRLLRVARHTTPEIGAVSEVHVDGDRSLTLLPMTPRVPIVLGWTRFAEQLARVRQILARWRGREGEIAQVSCLVRDQVIVRARTVATPPRGGKVPART